MPNASNYLATETLSNGLRLLIRATEPHDDLAGAVRRLASPKSFFLLSVPSAEALLDRRRNRTAHELRFVRQVALIGLVRHNLRMAIVARARYWMTGPDEAEITFMVADDYQQQGIGTAMLNHLCSIARQAGLKHLYALATPDNEGTPRLLNRLGFPCDMRLDPAQRIIHITVHLTSAAPTEGMRTTKETHIVVSSSCRWNVVKTMRRIDMTRSALIVVAAALLLSGTSLASAKIRGAASVRGKPLRPSINETTPRPTAADPYYRLSDSYYGYSDPYHGLFDFYAVPPYGPGNAYGYVRPIGR